jgi:hypothetical protein
VRRSTCRQIDGLSALVEGIMRHNPLSGSLFVFINKRRNKLKILTWECNGLEKFQLPVRSSETVVTLSGEQLNWLLDGYDVWRMKPHKALDYKHIA